MSWLSLFGVVHCYCLFGPFFFLHYEKSLQMSMRSNSKTDMNRQDSDTEHFMLVYH